MTRKTEERAQQLRQAAEKIGLNSEKIVNKFEGALGRIVEASSAALRDPKTGLATGMGMVESDMLLLEKYNKEGSDEEILMDHSVVVMDMMLFHRGVQELGGDFDARIALMAKGLISIAEYLSTDKEAMYAEMSQVQASQDEGLRLYFPEGSPMRQKLEHLKSLGIGFEPGRFNPGGGDEFLIKIDTNVRATDLSGLDRSIERGKRLALTMEVMDAVIKETTFAKDRPVIRERVEFSPIVEARRRAVFKYFYNHLNDSIPGVDEESGVSDSAARFVFEFKDGLRSYFLASESRFFQQGTGLMDTQVDLRLDYAMVGNAFKMPNMADTLDYIYGISPFGSPDSPEFSKYLGEVKARLAEKLEVEEINDPEAVRASVEEIVIKSLLEKYQQILFDEVNGEWKKRKKLDVMAAAAKGDPQAIFTVGSVVESGRSFSEFTNKERRKLWVNLIQYWVGEYKAECAKRDRGEKYDIVLVDNKSRMGELMEVATRTQASGNERWFDLIDGVIV